MLFVQFGINSIRDVWKFCQIGLAPVSRSILAKFPNITRTINPKLYSQSRDNLYISRGNSIYLLLSGQHVSIQFSNKNLLVL